jgi:protein-tyrosine phosphatase
MPVNVLFVCLGNICRSPTAHGVFQKMVDDAGLQASIFVESAGTADWHVGKSADSRSAEFASRRGYDLSPLRARHAVASDFDSFDYILAMDASNLADLKAIAPTHYAGHLGLLLDLDSRSSQREVPDPYYGGEQGFDLVLDLIEGACQPLLTSIKTQQGF